MNKFRTMVATAAALAVLFGLNPRAAGEILLQESFDPNMGDNSPIGGAPGWHAYALFAGAVTDYTTSTPNGNFPTLSQGPAGAVTGDPGYLVMGSGNIVSNVLVWHDTPTNFQNHTISNIIFYSKNNAAASTERIVVRIGGQWYASTATLNDTSTNAAWASNYFAFTTAASAWRSLQTNTLALGAVLGSPLPNGNISGIGLFGQIQADTGKIRLDEFRIEGNAVAMPPTASTPVAAPGTNVLSGTSVSLTVPVSGTPPFTYQWRKDGIPLTNAPSYAGTTSNVLAWAATSTNQSGNYDVIVSNAYGTNTSPSVFITVTLVRAATVDLSGYNASGKVLIAQPDTNTLVTTWSDKTGRVYRVHFNLGDGQPLLHRLETAATNGAAFITIAQNVDCKYRVILGSRRIRAGWPYIFFDSVDANSPTPTPHLSDWNADSVRVVSESDQRVKLSFSNLQLGPFAGELVCYLYDGSPLLHLQANMVVDQPWVAYIYDAICFADFSNVAYKDSAGVFQTKAAATLTQTVPGEAAKVVAKHRTIMGTVTGGQGTLAVVAPPHTTVYPTDFSVNFGHLQAGQGFIGTKMSYSADGRFRPWVDAPEGATQKMDVFLLFSTNTPPATLTNALAYTHGDFFKPVPGHYTMAEHFHPEFTQAYRTGGDTLTPFKQTLQSIGLQIVQPMEFHGPGNPFNDYTNRLSQLHDMFNLFEAHSDNSFLLIPGEEYNNFFGGHWSYMFPHRVYFTGWPGQGSREYRQTNVTIGSVTYPEVYQIGDSTRMMELLQDEGGLAWSSHPRVKASRLTPDSFVNSNFYQGSSFMAGDWKSLPADLSKDRLGFRGFQLMDDTAQWGYRKSMLGEVDTFQLDSTHEIYAHMNVNYLKLPAFPPKTNWSSVVNCVRNGEYFTTTGEVLIHSWTASSTGVTATVEWYFPPAFAEITWGDSNGVYRLKQSLVAFREFETRVINIPADLSNANWVRFETWDVARNGAFTQQHWFRPPENPPIITGRVANFTLINADTDSAVPGFDPIPNGAVLDRLNLPPNLNIRANISPLVMDRVTLNLDGAEVSRTQWPYTLAPCSASAGIGDSPFYDYAASTLTPGQHILSATPYRGTNARRSLTLNFSVTNSDPTSSAFVMNGLLDGTDYQIAPGLHAAIHGNILYVAAPLSESDDQFIFVTDSLTSLQPAPGGKSGQVAFNTSSKPYLAQIGSTVSWNNAGTNARHPTNFLGRFLEGTLDLTQAFAVPPSTLYLALAPYAPGNGGALIGSAQIPSGNNNAHVEANEFPTIPLPTLRDDNGNGVLDTLETSSAFRTAIAIATNGFTLRWPALPGRTYEVSAAPALPPAFENLSSNLLAGPGVFELCYTDHPPHQLMQRFYQVNRMQSPTRLLARFPFNGNADNLAPGTLTTTATSLTYTNDSLEGGLAARFDGTNSFVQCSGNPVGGSFSASFWIKTSAVHTGTAGDQWFNGTGLADADISGVNVDWGIALTGNAIAFGIGGGSMGANVTVTSPPINDGSWHHVVTIWEQGSRKMIIYVDAQNVATGLSNSDEARAGAALMIGRNTTATRFFRGLLDDLQFYDSPLTTNDVNALFQSPGSTLP